MSTGNGVRFPSEPADDLHFAVPQRRLYKTRGVPDALRYLRLAAAKAHTYIHTWADLTCHTLVDFVRWKIASCTVTQTNLDKLFVHHYIASCCRQSRVPRAATENDAILVLVLIAYYSQSAKQSTYIPTPKPKKNKKKQHASGLTSVLAR